MGYEVKFKLLYILLLSAEKLTCAWSCYKYVQMKEIIPDLQGISADRTVHGTVHVAESIWYLV